MLSLYPLARILQFIINIDLVVREHIFGGDFLSHVTCNEGNLYFTAFEPKKEIHSIIKGQTQMTLQK